MTFWDHLDELRAKVVNCLYVFFAGFLAFYFVSDKLLDWLRKPLFDYLPKEKQHLYYTGLFENFFVHLKVAGYASLVLLSPIYFFILWKFIAPGLYEKEKKAIFPFAVAASFFFIFGASFAYFFLFPAGVKYFLSFGTQAEVAWLTLENYVNLVLKILFGFGMCFQIPVIIVLLAKIGILSASQLEKQRRFAIMAVAFLSALVAPPDAISMLLLMVPLYLLYEGSILVVKMTTNTKRSS